LERTVASPAAVLALALWALGASPSASAEHLFRGLETGDLSEWRAQFYRGYGAQAVTLLKPEGGYALRFEMRSADTKVVRAELQPHQKSPGFRQQIGREYWYSFRMMLPSDWATQNGESQTLFQAHQKSGCTPPLALRVEGDQWRLKSRSTADKACNTNDSRTYSLGRIETGRWVDWAIRVKWSYEADGVLQVWKNGTRVVSQRGPNLYNVDQGPSPRIGIYKRKWSGAERQVYYVDSFRVCNHRESLSSAQRVR
jgi:hypothetical protein